MRIGMWMGAPLRALGMAAVMALAACGGGSSDDEPALDVTVKVDGVADSAGPLSAGETSTIEVPSGATLVFDSPGETRWEPATTDSTFAVNSFSFTSKSMTVSSNAGGTLVVVFTNKADASEKATLNVTVAPKEFQRIAAREGEIVHQKSKLYWNDGRITDRGSSSRVSLLENGQYGVDTADGVDSTAYDVRLLYDAQDAYLGWSSLIGSYSCLGSAPIAGVSYPMHVGKSWTGSVTSSCTGGSSHIDGFTFTVTAFERITIAAGDFDALRIESKSNYADSATSYSATGACWWAVETGRLVKCDHVYSPPEGTGGIKRSVYELVSGSN
jgi:hypothetical protein